jgi:hypothetical protein
MDQLQAEPRIAGQPQLRLYVRPSCLLCLEAEYLLASGGIDGFVRVDIERDPALEARYGTRIPVLGLPDGDELDWPFDADRLAARLAAAQSSS